VHQQYLIIHYLIVLQAKKTFNRVYLFESEKLNRNDKRRIKSFNISSNSFNLRNFEQKLKQLKLVRSVRELSLYFVSES
jgi:hypothetical protein